MSLVVRTERLVLREQTTDDAAFILALVNDADWLRHIGDRGVRTLDDARAYIDLGARAMGARYGFALWLVEEAATGAPVGVCGLLRRDDAGEVDLGFAFAPAYRGRGYAGEAARATLDLAHSRFGLHRVVAFVSPGNDASLSVLARLGFVADGETEMASGARVLRLACDLDTRL